ncbi:MAG: hypothetical protein OZ948_19165 [Deltaproteobacteria bacterium]|nr:hypothetical protein [Deltaproteobacteria bacterium]
MARRRPDPTPPPAEGGDGAHLLAQPRALVLLGLAFVLVALAVYAPSLSGAFVSDDLHYVATNPYVHELSARNLVEILDPNGTAAVFVVNYTPVHLLLHALEWQLFGDAPFGFHVVNVVLHAAGALLLVLVFARAGLPAALALFGGGLFLLHPANVEAVAWVSQLKTPSSFVLAMGALLAHPRRPALAALLFALALLAKPTAAAVLPVAAILDWTREGRVRAGWLALWAVALGGYAVAELWTHQRTGAAEPLHPDSWVRLRTSFAIAARYAWMSLSSLGVSTFHEPAPVLSWRDPWWLAGAALSLLLAVRGAVCLLGRRAEAAFWALAGASFLPVSQLFPFLHPMADRYLYYILPGLLGGALFAGLELWTRRAPALGAALRSGLAVAAPAAAVALVAGFAVHANARARIWASPARILADAARHYPEGRSALLLHARRAAQAGDNGAAIRDLRAAWELGFNRFEQLQGDPVFAPLRGDPRFQALVREIAGWWVARFSSLPNPTQLELRVLATAHLARGEHAEALAALERALARGGPIDERIRAEIAQVRALGG